jgi:RNA-directed DNA polymerase
MSLKTPDAIRTLQRKLYDKAKTEPDFRFYILYDKVWRPDILHHAYRLARANDGAPGVDGTTFEQIETMGLENWLSRLGEELRAKAYRCQPVRRVMIPKPGGGERPLGIPTIRDRVVQTAAKLVLEPIFEADLDPAAFGYRPKRGAGEAIQRVLALLRQGYTDVVDADLSKYFDTIPHPELMRTIARRIVDSDMLGLIKQWLKAPVETTDGDGGTRMAGGKASRMGVPQGGVISPLVANLYMNRFLKYWRQTGKGEAWDAHVINYADDFVSPADAFRDISPLRGLILSRGYAAEALAWTDGVMTRLGLTLNRTKTRLCDARTDRFDFLGYSFGPHCHRQQGRWFTGASPSDKSVQRLKDKLGAILVPGNKGPWAEVRGGLNRLLRGWCGYFSPGTHYVTDRVVEAHLYDRVRNFLVRRHKMPSRSIGPFSMEAVFGDLGMPRLRHLRRKDVMS